MTFRKLHSKDQGQNVAYLEKLPFHTARAPPTALLHYLIMNDAGQHLSHSETVVVAAFYGKIRRLTKARMHQNEGRWNVYVFLF